MTKQTFGGLTVEQLRELLPKCTAYHEGRGADFSAAEMDTLCIALPELLDALAERDKVIEALQLERLAFYAENPIGEIVEQAIAAERERCAKIAESQAYSNENKDQWTITVTATALRIAAAIRQPAGEKEKADGK